VGTTQPPIQWVPGALSLRVKRPGHEADHSPSTAEVKECVKLYLHYPNTSSWRAQLKKSQGQLYLYLYFFTIIIIIIIIIIIVIKG
jgi:hypothetical protein